MLRFAAPLALFLGAFSVAGKNAADIPRFRTPGPAPWPQNGVIGCGITGLPPSGILADCTEPLHPDAPDLRGYWYEEGKLEDGAHELIEMCGSRWIDISKPVVHDHPACDGTLEGGVEDYSGPAIAMAEIDNNNLQCRGMCSSITTAAKFGTDADGNKCVDLYADTMGFGLSKVVTRCLQPDGGMIWVHPRMGTVYYRKMTPDTEPNCVTCPDGSVSTQTTDVLACSYLDRKWTRCAANTTSNIEDLGQYDRKLENGVVCKVQSPIPGPLILGIASVVILLAISLCCFSCRKNKKCCFKKTQAVESELGPLA